MKFSADWVEGAPNRAAEEAATVCDLQIQVGEFNACRHWDEADGQARDRVRVPAVHLAEGLATDWWKIFGGRDVRHPVRPYRSGFVLPSLEFSCDGSEFRISLSRMEWSNPDVTFLRFGEEVVSRREAEQVLSGFIDSVADRLSGSGIWESETQLRWGLVKESMLDAEESKFCEAAGALGLDPYLMDEAGSRIIEQAAESFSGAALTEFLAGVKGFDVHRRQVVLSGIGEVSARCSGLGVLPDLPELVDDLSPVLHERRMGEGAWAPGYRLARDLRSRLGFGPFKSVASVDSLADVLGNSGFMPVSGLFGVDAVVSRNGGTFAVHLRGGEYVPPTSQVFSLARSVADLVFYPHGGLSVVNRLHRAERQAVGRAFAAEFLAPAEEVAGMALEGYEAPDIASRFGVSEMVVAHQMENCDRILAACSPL